MALREDDDRVRLPPAVRERIEAGRRAAEVANAPPLVDDAEPPPPPVASAEASDKDAPEPPPLPTDDQSSVTNDELPPAQETPPDATAYAALIQVHRTLQGKYNRETAAARATMLEQSQQIQRLTTQLTELNARLSAQPKDEKKGLTPARGRAKALTEEEIAEVGPDLVDIIARKAEEIAAGLVEDRLTELGLADVGPKLQTLTGSVEQVAKRSQATARDQFNQWMDANVTGWREIDADPLFLDWLDGEDEFSGMKRSDIMRSAMQTGNYRRVKLTFEGYAKERGIITQATQRTRPNEPPANRVKLETVVAPNGRRGRTQAIVPSDTPEAPLTTAEITAYYRTRALKPNKFSEAEVAQMERRISAVLRANAASNRAN